MIHVSLVLLDVPLTSSRRAPVGSRTVEGQDGSGLLQPDEKRPRSAFNLGNLVFLCFLSGRAAGAPGCRSSQ